MTVIDALPVLACVVSAIALFLYQRKWSSGNAPLPPGPRPLPLLGNLRDIPVTHEYQTYAQWGKQYGDVVYVHALNKEIVVLNSFKAANELLVGRSAIYSDRPVIPMLHDARLMNSNRSLVFKRHGPEWRRQRHLFTRHLGPATSRTFSDTLTSSAHTLLYSMLHSPEELTTHLRYNAAETSLAIAYGYKIKPKDDPLVALAEEGIEVISQMALPGRFLVNTLTWLKYVPAWFPGAGFKAFAEVGRVAEDTVVDMSYRGAKRRIAEGTAIPSFMTNALADPSREGNLEDIKAVAVTMYGAASDTTVSSMKSCILALILDPAIQRRAQAELDVVLGPVTSPTFRLPTFSDRPRLPYIDAIVKESLRWLPVAPMGVVHATTAEDVYRGWRIPRGALVIANAWAMLRDETIYPEPSVFRPERFLGENPAPHPGSRGCFGFGSRECPGRNLAEDSLWIQIASILAVFSLSPAKDKDGKVIDYSYACAPLPGLILHTQPYLCDISVRSREAEMRIHEMNPEA